jgi:tRNA(Arg) A34 adenosine deaminase TadA
MRIAIRLSEQNVQKALGGPFGAIIVKEEKIIARSGNRVTSACDPTAHAEVVAIRKAARKLHTYDLSGCVIYTSCEPCPMCLGAIYWARISEIYYANTKSDAADAGFSDRFIYEELQKPNPERNLRITRMLGEEAKPAFRLWNEANGKAEY